MQPWPVAINGALSVAKLIGNQVFHHFCAT
jgi:hypothetical protein